MGVEHGGVGGLGKGNVCGAGRADGRGAGAWVVGVGAEGRHGARSGWQDAYGMGVGVGGWGGAGAIYRTSVGSHAGRVKNVTNTNGARSHGSSGGAGCVGGGGGGWKCGKGGVLGVGMTPGARGP